MDTLQYTLETLFEQLGLDGDEDAVARFTEEHRPVPTGTELADASFWSDSQAGFLREAISRDSPWALPVDELDALLRER